MRSCIDHADDLVVAVGMDFLRIESRAHRLEGFVSSDVRRVANDEQRRDRQCADARDPDGS